MEDYALSQEQRNTYERDGVLLLRNVVSRKSRKAIQGCFERVVDEFTASLVAAGELTEDFAELDFQQRWAAVRTRVPASRPIVWRRAIIDPALHRLWSEPGLLGAARSVLGSELRAYDLFNGRPREPLDHSQTIGWHQDAFNSPDWAMEDGQVLTFWVPLVPVGEASGCLAVQPGSHHSGLLPQTTDEFGVTHVGVELDNDTGVPVPMEPGDALMFNDLTLHRSLHNMSDRVRWSVDIRYAEDSPAHRRKSPGGFRVHSLTEPAESFEEWVAKWDPKKGPMRRELRRLDLYARSLGKDGRDVQSY